MRNFLKCSAVLLLSASLFAQANKKPAPKAPAPAPTPAANAAPAGAPSQEVVEAYFKRMFGYDPNLQVRVANIVASPIPDLYDAAVIFATPEGQQATHFFISKDQKHAIAGDMLPFGADPFQHDREELAKSAFGPTKGPADAKLLIVEFADLECPSCSQAAATMEKLRNDYPQARFVFQSFPLPQHPWAVRASAYLDCIARTNNDQAFTFADSIFKHQSEIENAVRKTDPTGKTTVDEAVLNERLRTYAQDAGADPAKTQTCADSSETLGRINRSEQLAHSLNVTGTPTLFVNGRRVGNPGGVPYEALKAVINFEADQAK